MQRTCLALLFAALAWLRTNGAHAGVDVPTPTSAVDATALDAPVPTSAADAATLDARIGELERALTDVQRPARRYFTGWLVASSVMAASQGTIGLLVDDRAQRASMFLGAGLTVAGIGLLLITPMPGRHGADELRGMPTGSLAEKRAAAMRGEVLLRGEASSARFRRAWFQHAFVAALSGGVGVVLGVGYPDSVWSTAVPAAVGTLVISELQIWTRPKAAIGHWERYRTGVPSIALVPSLAPEMRGVSLQARF